MHTSMYLSPASTRENLWCAVERHIQLVRLWTFDAVLTLEDCRTLRSSFVEPSTDGPVIGQFEVYVRCNACYISCTIYGVTLEGPENPLEHSRPLCHDLFYPQGR